MNTKLITEIKKNAFIVVLDEADTSEQELKNFLIMLKVKITGFFFITALKQRKYLFCSTLH